MTSFFAKIFDKALRRKTVLSKESVTEHVWVESGRFDANKLSLFSIFRDEIYFCCAFFDHYRKIGVEQFLIIDDGSTDGTREFLAAQPDCVLLKSRHAYGRKGTKWIRPDGTVTVGRAGDALKCLVPYHFFQGQFALFADADEFLLLPPGVDNLARVINWGKATGHRAFAAQLVEFFPEKLPPKLEAARPPVSATELFSAEWFFEEEILISVTREGKLIKQGKTKSEMLFEDNGIVAKGILKFTSNKPTSPRSKVPFLQHNADTFRRGAHSVNIELCPTLIFSMVHFVWTDNFFAKIDRAITVGGHAKGSAKYHHYRTLVERIEARGGVLLGTRSRRFKSAQDFINLGIMLWPISEDF